MSSGMILLNILLIAEIVGLFLYFREWRKEYLSGREDRILWLLNEMGEMCEKALKKKYRKGDGSCS